MSRKRLAKEDYTVGWICALPVPELKASRLLFDGDEHEDVILDHKVSHQYVYGEMNGHNIVMGCLPVTQMGKASAAAVATEMHMTFPGLQFGLIVGIGGAVPSPNDIRLGDVVVGVPDLGRQHGGVVQYDFGKAMHDGKFVKTGQMNQPPISALSGLGKLRSAPPQKSKFCRYLDSYKKDKFWDRGQDDRLFSATYTHVEGQATCVECHQEHEQSRPDRLTYTPFIHYGSIASGDQVMKDAAKRDSISQQHGGVLCFEMEAAGVTNILPCLVVRGMCDYCDSHKNKEWQPFAAAAAAAWAKDLLRNIAPMQSKGHGAVYQQDRFETAQDVWMQRFVGQLTTTKRSVGDIAGLINRISSYDPQKILNRIDRKKLPGTTEWLTGTPAFVDWESSASARSNILWLSGKVGSGKTFAMTTAVRHLLGTVQPSPRTKIIHHFLQYPSFTAVDVFRSLSKQLIQFYIDANKQCSSELVRDLDMHFGDYNRSPDLDELVDDIVLPLTYAIDVLFVCVDGIDMSEEHEQRQFWSGLRGLLQQRTKQNKATKILITAANESKLPTLLPEDALRIRLDHGLTSNDIEMYIDARLQERAHPRELFHDIELRNRVKEALLHRAENMFLWVHIQLEEILHNCTTPAEVDLTLRDLPKTLADLYLSCLKRKSRDKTICNPRVLKWCSAAREPLCVDVLSDMLALDHETGDVDRNRRPHADSVIQSGVSLLTLEEPDMLLEPAHHSIRYFMFSDLLCGNVIVGTGLPSDIQDELAMSMDETEREIGQLCVSHVRVKTSIDVQVYRAVEAPPILGLIPPFMQKGFRLGQRKTQAPRLPILRPTKQKQDTASFLQYAIRTWLLHTTKFEKATPAWDKFEYVALQPNASWGLHPWPAIGNTQISHLRGLLGHAVANNHQPLLQLLVDEPALLPRKLYDEVLPGNELLPALHIAAKFGHTDLITMLLKMCSANTLCPQDRRTALHVALAHGQDQFATLLCGIPEVKVDILDANGASPLALALRHDQYSTSRILLTSSKVKIGSRDDGLTPEEREDCFVCSEILRGTRDVNSRDRDRSTPLHNAARRRNQVMVKLLLENQADVNAEDSQRRTPLHYAAMFESNEAIMKLLLAGQADVAMKDNKGWTPLHHAATHQGDTVTMRLLLESQADVHTEDDGRSTPLHKAAFSGNDAAVKLLLARQANVNAKNSNGSAPLHEAAVRGNDAIVRLLLDTSKVEVNAKRNEGTTPLHLAASKGHEGVVGQLLATGKADVNSRDFVGYTPLHYAASRRHYAVVNLLVDVGKANVDLGNSSDAAPLLGGSQRQDLLVDVNVHVGEVQVDLQHDPEPLDPVHTPSSLVHSGNYNRLRLLLEHDLSKFQKR